MLKSVEQAIQDAANEIARRLQEIEDETDPERLEQLLLREQQRHEGVRWWSMANGWFTEMRTEEWLEGIERGFAFVYEKIGRVAWTHAEPRDRWITGAEWTRWQLSPEEKEIERAKVRTHLESVMNGARFTAAFYGKNVVKETAEFFYVLWKNGLLRTLAVAQQLLEPDELVLLDMKMECSCP